MITEVDLTELTAWRIALAHVPDQLDTELLASHQVVMGETINIAKENAPHKDGPLRADIRILTPAHKSGNGYEGKVGTDLIYSAQREYGGTIHARNGGWLVFQYEKAVTEQNPEGWVFVKSVTQTGSFYMRDAADVMSRKAVQYYQLGLSRSLEGAF